MDDSANCALTPIQLTKIHVEARAALVSAPVRGRRMHISTVNEGRQVEGDSYQLSCRRLAIGPTTSESRDEINEFRALGYESDFLLWMDDNLCSYHRVVGE